MPSQFHKSVNKEICITNTFVQIYPWEGDLVRTVQETGWVPGSVCTGARNLTSTSIQHPDREILYHHIFQYLWFFECQYEVTQSSTAWQLAFTILIKPQISSCMQFQFVSFLYNWNFPHSHSFITYLYVVTLYYILLTRHEHILKLKSTFYCSTMMHTIIKSQEY
jgi:hypothetical protein